MKKNIISKEVDNHIVYHCPDTMQYWAGVSVGWWEERERPALEAYLDHLAEQGYTWLAMTCECGCTDLRRPKEKKIEHTNSKVEEVQSCDTSSHN